MPYTKFSTWQSAICRQVAGLTKSRRRVLSYDFIINFKQLTLYNNLVRFSPEVGTRGDMKTINAQTSEFFDDNFLNVRWSHRELPPEEETQNAYHHFLWKSDLFRSK